jgi:FkbM family methyltransferase
VQDLLNKIAESGCSKLGTVLHLGAGACRELKGFLQLKADKIALVEANPELADLLRLKVRGVEQAEVFSAAVAPTEGETTLSVLNNPRESSLRRPALLLKRYPNLTVTRDIPVPGITLHQLVERLSPAATCCNLLMVELQGAELAVLNSTPVEILQKFSWIAIRTSAEALYDGGARLEEVDVILRGSGFDPVGSAEPVLTLPFQDVLYHYDARQDELQALNAVLGEREKTIHALTQSLIEHERQNKELEQLLERRLRQLRMADERQSETARLTRERDQLAAEVVEARQAASLSMKLQTLREADLKDLQSRYETTRSIQQTQHELLVKLAEKLTVASRYFYPLADNQSVPLIDDEQKLMPEPKQQSRNRPKRVRRTSSLSKLTRKKAGST